MGRLGGNAAQATSLVRGIEQESSIELASVWTHFARADEAGEDFTALQTQRFQEFIESLGGAPAPLHVAASAAIYNHPETIDASVYSMARVGIAMYGLLDLPADVGGERQAPPEPLLPVMEFSSRVCAIKRVPAGTPISYGTLWKSDRETTIATISAGYADGVLRDLSPGGHVRIGHDLYPIRGRICMDMMMVDIGENDSNIRVGDSASIFGAQKPTCFDVADHASSITYVAVCSISSRVPRVYKRS